MYVFTTYISDAVLCYSHEWKRKWNNSNIEKF